MSESTSPAEPVSTSSEPSSDGPRSAPAKPSKKARSAQAGSTTGRTPEQLERRQTIIRWAVFVGGGALLTVLLYVILSSFLPRWWAGLVGRQAGGRVSGGIVLGLLYGFVFTFFPLILLAQARHRAFSWRAKTIIVLAAAALTAPNLITLAISVGTGPAAHAGERTLDVTAPGFRQATLWGVILGALTAVVVVGCSILWERRGRELKLLRARVDQLEKELPPALPLVSPADPPAGS